MPLYRPAIIPSRTVQLLYRGIGLNFNTTADQVLTKLHRLPIVILNAFSVNEASGSIAFAVGGIYTAAAKGGVAVVAASTAYTAVSGAGLGMRANTAAAGLANFADPSLYFALSTPHGSAATANVLVWGWGYDS